MSTGHIQFIRYMDLGLFLIVLRGFGDNCIVKKCTNHVPVEATTIVTSTILNELSDVNLNFLSDKATIVFI